MKYKIYHFIWLIPAWLLFLGIYEVYTYNGLVKTYQEGTSYIANVDYFRMKDLQAQSNGVIILSFDTKEGEHIRKQMTLPVKLAALIQDYTKIPIRYLKDSSEPVVMIPPYNFHRHLFLSNMGILSISVLIAIGIAVWVERHFWKEKHGLIPSIYKFEIVDQPSA